MLEDALLFDDAILERSLPRTPVWVAAARRGTMKYIEVEYNQELKHLDAILSDVRHPGDFFVAGALEIPMPRVEVEGAGTLSFPIPSPQIKAIVQQATRAPYGRGEETIVDTSVRNVWQIAPGAIKISGKSWAANFENILSKVTAGSRLPGREGLRRALQAACVRPWRVLSCAPGHRKVPPGCSGRWS